MFNVALQQKQIEQKTKKKIIRKKKRIYLSDNVIIYINFAFIYTQWYQCRVR